MNKTKEKIGMQVIKRDGSCVDYDRSKIATAIRKANAEVEDSEKISEEKIGTIIDCIEKKNRKRMLVEDIQDIIEQKLMDEKKFVLAKTYIIYRYSRALVRKAPVYIFDDSFSALDFRTDAKLRRALSAFTKDSIVLIVAQRVSTILNAEQIIVLDEGKIVGRGTHRELLETCPTYREIAESQLSKEELA